MGSVIPVLDAEPGIEQPVTRGRAGGILGVLSAALLYASLRWAHHWGPLAYSVVMAWALVTIAAFVVSVWSLRTSRASRRFAKWGVALTLVSLLALMFTGVLSTMGVDAAGACGGG
jgi:hypothetical protein